MRTFDSDCKSPTEEKAEEKREKKETGRPTHLNNGTRWKYREETRRN